MPSQFKLSQVEERDLSKRSKEEKSWKIQRRLLFLKLKNRGFSHRAIAPLCGVCIDTLTDWLGLYEHGGLAALCLLQYDGRRTSKLDSVKEELAKGLEEGKYDSLAAIQSFLKKEHDIHVGQPWIWTYCKKNSLPLGSR
jgi:transposase